MERRAQSRRQHGRAGQELPGWARTLLGSAEAGGAGAEPPPPRRLQPHSSSGRENHGCPKRVRGRLEADNGTPVAVEEVCVSGIPFSRSAAADLDLGPDSALDPITDEEDEQDLRLPGAAAEELPGLTSRGRRGTEGASGDGAVSPLGWQAAAPLAVCRCCGGGGGGSVGGGHPARHPVLPGHPRCYRTLHRGAQPHGSPHHRGWGRRARPAPRGGESWWERSAEPRGGSLGGHRWGTCRTSCPA